MRSAEGLEVVSVVVNEIVVEGIVDQRRDFGFFGTRFAAVLSVIPMFRQLSVILLTSGRHFRARECLLKGLDEELRTRIMAFDEKIAKRRAIVKSNPKLSVKELCEIFDQRQIPVPRRWKDAGIEWWTKAYHQGRFRGRVHNLVSKDRARNDE